MLNREYQGQNCSIARALELVGERWTLLIIRDAFLGLRRFDEFQESLGISRNVLTDRLNRLVDEGIFEAVPYGSRPDRYDYSSRAWGLISTSLWLVSGNGETSTCVTHHRRSRDASAIAGSS